MAEIAKKQFLGILATYFMIDTFSFVIQQPLFNLQP